MTSRNVLLFFCLASLVSAAHIQGSISTSTGSIPSYTTIYAASNGGPTFRTRTSGSAFSLTVSDDHIYNLYAIASDNVDVSGWSVDGYLPLSVSGVTTEVGTTIVNLSFEPSWSLVLISYSGGQLLQSSDFSPYVWVTDLEGVTTEFARSTAIANGTTTLALSIPLNQQVVILSETQVPSQGAIVLPANNGGAGFGSSTQGGVVVQLNYETARTSLDTVNAKSQRSGYNLPLQFDVQSSYATLEGSFASAEARASASDILTGQSLSAETTMELLRAESNAQRYRTSNLTVKATDELGRAVDGVSISIEQIEQDFRFGVYGGQDSKAAEASWLMLADAGINAATIDFWWSETEPTNGTIEEEYILNQKISYLASLGLKLRATGLFQPDPAIIPAYVQGLDSAAFGQALYDHVYNLVSRFCTEFDLIEVSTDLNNLGTLLGYNSSEILNLQQISLDAIRSAAPGVRTSVTISSAFEQSSSSPITATQFNKQWAAAGQYIDQIGLAIYDGEGDEPQYSIGAISDQLDALSAAGRPLRLSQVSAPSGFNQQESVAFLEQVYTIAFSKKYLREISWWGLIGDSHLFSADQTPTPLFWALRDAIHRTRTNIVIPLEKTNTAQVTPLGGTHRVTASKNGAVLAQSDIHLDEGRAAKLAVIYRSDGSGATILVNPTHGPVDGVVPAPLAYVSKAASSSPGSSLPGWSIFVIIFGTIAVVGMIGALITLIVVRNMSRGKKAPDASPASGGPIAPFVSGKTFDIEAPKPEAEPEPIALDEAPPTPRQPLTAEVAVPLDDSSQHEDDTDTDTESSGLEDVELEEDVSTSTSDTEDEEHL